MLPNNCSIIGIDKLAFTISDFDIERLQLEEKKLWVKDETREVTYCKGEIYGIQVSSRGGYTSFELNPAKLFYGDNFSTLNFSDFAGLIEDIEIQLGFSIKQAVVRKIHIQTTIKVDVSPKNYFEILGNSRNYSRALFKSTLYYDTEGQKKYKTNLFYDKKKQSKWGRLEGEYLRFENQYYNDYIKNIAKKVNKENILIEDLLNPEIYKIFVTLWLTEYSNINKEREIIFDLINGGTPAEIDKLLINLGIKSLGGQMAFEKILNASKPYSSRKSDFFSKLKARYRAITHNPNTTISGKLLSELNSKVELAYQNTINDITDI